MNYGNCLISISKKTQVLDKKCSNSRLAKSEKCEFTMVNDHFEDKHNAEVGLFSYISKLLSKVNKISGEVKYIFLLKFAACEFTYIYSFSAHRWWLASTN
jgi:hypothetical protein